MSFFKEQLEKDLRNIFHNSAEFAEMTKIKYGDKRYTIPVVLDWGGARISKQGRTAESGLQHVLHDDGIFQTDLTLYVAFCDLGVMPRKGAHIVVGGDDFEIITVAHEEGELVIGLRRLDE